MQDAASAIDELDATTFVVRDLIGASRDLVVRMARVMGMNTTDMTAIDLLNQHGPLGAADLGARLGIRSASTTALVDRLERAGHVERIRDTDDRRRVTLRATDTAAEVALQAWLPPIQDVDAVCRALSEDEQAVVQAFLVRITAAMDRGGRPT